MFELKSIAPPTAQGTTAVPHPICSWPPNRCPKIGWGIALLAGLSGIACGADGLSKVDGALIAPDTIELGRIRVGEQRQVSFSVSTEGPATVKVDALKAVHPELALSADPLPLELAVGDTTEVQVIWSPQAAGEHNGQIEIQTNLTDQKIVVVRTHGEAITLVEVTCPPDGRSEEPPLVDRWFEEMWAASPTDIWAVGEGGTAIHWDGNQWAVIDTCTTETLYSVWGTGSSDVWAVGQKGSVLHWDGVSWSPRYTASTESFWSVWSNSPVDVWTVGTAGTTIHFDGQSWRTYPCETTETLWSVWGSDAQTIWTVGAQGGIFRWRGNGWAAETSPAAQSLYSVRGTSPNNVWAVGLNGIIVHYDGIEWSPIDSGTDETLFSVWGQDEKTYWVSGDLGTIRQHTPTGWIDLSTSNAGKLYAMWGTAGSDIWFGGSSGLLLHWNGQDLDPINP